MRLITGATFLIHCLAFPKRLRAAAGCTSVPNRRRRFTRWVATVVILFSPVLETRADEGMWLYNNAPRQYLRETYGFELTDDWLDHLRLASVHFGGGSAEFVSEEGLILSNHHVGSRAVQKLSTPEHNYLRDGFYARTRAEEKPCAGLELRVLMQIQDVTSRVNAAVPAGMTDEEAFKARRAAIAAIEKESLDQTGLRSEVVTLYQGAQYHLYRYKKYNDIRLVFAPEEQIAFYGGDPDNFEYPRFDLDICFFRAYENGAPANTPHYLRWSKSGPKEQELVFVSGHPGRTDRLRTVAELEFLRDVEYPRTLERLKRSEVLLTAYSARSAENARRARGDLFSARNGRKVRDGALAGLLDPAFMRAKRAAEQRFRAKVAEHPELSDLLGAWDRIAEAQKLFAQNADEEEMLERGSGFNSVLFTHARELLRAAEERPKPDAERLEEYHESARASFEFRLLAESPVYPDLETIKLGDSLTWLAQVLGYESPVVQKALAGQSPRQRAADLISSTKLASAKVRKELYRGGADAMAQAKDPLIELAQLVDIPAREVRKTVAVQREVIRQAHAQIGKARYALEGSSQYPDATSSLRLAFGTTKGYQEDGHRIAFQTTVGGLYERAAAQNYRPPFELPSKWIAKRSRLDLSLPLDFVCTADIIGGNSGSPVVNRQGEFVGIIFDGNIQSLTAGFAYTEDQARALAVHSSAILEALRIVYDAKPLAEELVGGRGKR
jgi:hypothetical protein